MIDASRGLLRDHFGGAAKRAQGEKWAHEEATADLFGDFSEEEEVEEKQKDDDDEEGQDRNERRSKRPRKEGSASEVKGEVDANGQSEGRLNRIERIELGVKSIILQMLREGVPHAQQLWTREVVKVSLRTWTPSTHGRPLSNGRRQKDTPAKDGLKRILQRHTRCQGLLKQLKCWAISQVLLWT